VYCRARGSRAAPDNLSGALFSFSVVCTHYAEHWTDLVLLVERPFQQSFVTTMDTSVTKKAMHAVLDLLQEQDADEGFAI
jgi:hypothetical protein